jgi:hypothetical protein
MTIGMNASPRKEKIPKGYSKGSINQYTPEQEQQFQSQFKHIDDNSYLSRLAGGDQSLYDEMEAPAMRQFQSLQGQIGSRFSGMGMGSQKSSGFQNTQNQAASDFAQDLQGKRMGLRNQAIESLMGMSNTLLGQRPQEQVLTEKPKPWWQEAATGFAGGLGQGLGKAAGNWLGG